MDGSFDEYVRSLCEEDNPDGRVWDLVEKIRPGTTDLLACDCSKILAEILFENRKVRGQTPVDRAESSKEAVEPRYIDSTFEVAGFDEPLEYRYYFGTHVFPAPTAEVWAELTDLIEAADGYTLSSTPIVPVERVIVESDGADAIDDACLVVQVLDEVFDEDIRKLTGAVEVVDGGTAEQLTQRA